MPKSSMTMAAVSDDEAMLGVFERLALDAGREVMRVFYEGCAVDEKSDASPVTEADRESEKIILAGLRAAYPDIPCVAEEEVAAGVATPDLDGAFFLIDPLDGTREFVNRRTDFTVNIALVRHGVPEVGVVFAPCTGRFFSGRPGKAESIDVDSDYRIVGRRPIAVREGSAPLAVVASRSHNTPETDAFIRDLGAAEIVSIGSSLKFCLLAAAEADVYPRFGRTMEWDTAAGDAVLRAAGGMTRTLDGQPLVYGKRNQASDSDFANPHFIATGKGAP
ncbi:MAG: 3'(2'),5'-bisphosphate nucleotidase CysQ [Mesorhizobium sp.]|nr:MAG: 3'(2'),5'-bisphosphate nucleotidase [Mesorhizobium sp.]RWK30974.1 MAG: 3'(2'),5'-bisphosphate nucleotidase [Mesorhizobium sp.]TIQ42592.1 MAG: 3'(2'),5'-bisphosphate nucleotidase CysQ [Mesorhizobium sp.]